MPTAHIDLSRLLKIGRYEIESDDVGTVQLLTNGDALEVIVRFNLPAMRDALLTTGLFLSDDQKKRTSRVEQGLARATALISEWQREWLTRTLLGDAEISEMTTSNFLRWAETHSRDIDLWLAVPAVREKIRSINNCGSAPTKRRLAKVLAGVSDVRPQRMPDPIVLYTRVRLAEPSMVPIHSALDAARNPRQLWASLKSEQPSAASELEKLGLHEIWFVGNRPRSPWRMACDLVAAANGLKSSTVEKVAGSVREQRENLRKHRPPRRRPVLAQQRTK